MIVAAILDPEDHRQPPDKTQGQPRHQRSTAQHHHIHAPLPLRASRPAQPRPNQTSTSSSPGNTNPAALCSSSYALHHINLPRPDLAQPTRPQLSPVQPSPHAHAHIPPEHAPPSPGTQRRHGPESESAPQTLRTSTAGIHG
jgi:hypothetical protein